MGHTRVRYVFAVHCLSPALPVASLVERERDALVRAVTFHRLRADVEPDWTNWTEPACQGVMVRFDEERCDLIKVLIIGNIDTPYAGGCFEYHIW